MKKRTILIILILAAFLGYVGLKVQVYCEVKSLFPYSLPSHNETDAVPSLLNLGAKEHFQTKEIAIRELIFEYPEIIPFHPAK